MSQTFGSTRDLLQNGLATGLLYVLPILALIASSFLPLESIWRPIIWTMAFATMGAACTANAWRCGRVHCFVTGPLFLLGALAALLDAVSILRLSAAGWNALSGAMIVGAVLACCVMEPALGKYRRVRP